MNTVKKKVAILGSTGSVGRQALDASLSAGCEIVLLTGSANVALLAEQIKLSGAKCAALPDENAAEKLRTLIDDSVKVYGGADAICGCIENCGADIFVHSISGMAGIPSAVAASKTGARLAIANKESIISLGDVIFDNIRKSDGELIPVDSEHSAIFQCLLTSGAIDARGNAKPDIVKRILLTASGGPFFGKTREELSCVTPEAALAHPTWSMGPKITIDSATLMNKGFEIIEACRLFGVPIEKVEVVVHRQSIIHSMVEYIDTMVMAQLGRPDMRHCVRYAISFPDRLNCSDEGLDFAALKALTFDRPDTKAFPLLSSAVDAYKLGSTAPAALIAADEEAVSAFLKGAIGFNDISNVVSETLGKLSFGKEISEASVFETERASRDAARAIISQITL